MHIGVNTEKSRLRLYETKIFLILRPVTMEVRMAINYNYIFEIKGYLDALSRVNSMCTGSDASYYFEFDELDVSEHEISANRHFLINKNEKIFYGTLFELRDWEVELKNSCNRWFNEGVGMFGLMFTRYDEIRDSGKKISSKIKYIINTRTFASDGFIELIKKLFGTDELLVYSHKYTKEYENHGDLVNDDYVFIGSGKIYFLHFGIND